ncbi:hypothetical protein QPK32_15980 [Massilia sp. YIM B02763]|uniref:hypothetical protein n=1 Tax=Massilia sp. YIM B02763 TaxID=3050130 RepID=UPI0025B63F48|nr:hypothetical protein [Massilia sp. YIM B02763]
MRFEVERGGEGRGCACAQAACNEKGLNNAAETMMLERHGPAPENVIKKELQIYDSVNIALS